MATSRLYRDNSRLYRDNSFLYMTNSRLYMANALLYIAHARLYIFYRRRYDMLANLDHDLCSSLASASGAGASADKVPDPSG